MIRSMTGYGEASAQTGAVQYFLEARSLNNKYFKAIIRLPEEFQGLEAELESRLRARLTRGSVTLTGTCTDTSASAAFEINHRALERYIEQISKTPQVASGRVPVDVGALLNLPGVLQPPAEEAEKLAHARDAFNALLDKALDDLIAMRRREGQALEKDLLAQGDLIADRLASIAERAPERIAEYEKRLQERIQMLLTNATIAPQPMDVIREIAVFAERADIAEEVTRLGGHIEQFRELLDGNDDRPVGRTLDFLAQEMLREANTIASKSSDRLISRHTVEIKGAIDRIKEQVQNAV